MYDYSVLWHNSFAIVFNDQEMEGKGLFFFKWFP